MEKLKKHLKFSRRIHHFCNIKNVKKIDLQQTTYSKLNFRVL